MRIDKIHIQNFKGFKDQTFEFKEQFTVFIGDNAKGKTSVLDALAIAAGSFFLGIDGIEPRKIEDREIRIITIDGQPKPQKPVAIEVNGQIDNEEIKWKRGIENKKTTHKEATTIRTIAAQKLNDSRKQSGVRFPIIAYYGTGRLWAEHEKIKDKASSQLPFQLQGEGVTMAYKNSLSAKSSTKEFLSWIKTQEDSITKFAQPLDIAHLKAFKQAVLTLMPNNTWQDMAFDRKQDELMGIFTDDKGVKNKLAFSQLSDGYRNAISLAADIAYRCIQLNPSFGERAVLDSEGIVLIDEIDMHLHPNWQQHFIGDLKKAFPKIQFVATTHSLFIVHSLRETELINLDETEGLESDPLKLSYEEIAEEMGVKDVPRSPQFIEMTEVAAEYYTLIAQGKTSKTDTEVAILRQKLNELEERYSDDPSFVGLLKAERQAHKL
jgi:predicted ATP-binding protein involved in virulence